MSSITAISEVPKVNGESEKRQDVELVLVIDKSGSMSGEKIKSVKETLLLLQKQMEFMPSTRHLHENAIKSNEILVFMFAAKKIMQESSFCPAVAHCHLVY